MNVVKLFEKTHNEFEGGSKGDELNTLISKMGFEVCYCDRDVVKLSKYLTFMSGRLQDKKKTKSARELKKLVIEVTLLRYNTMEVTLPFGETPLFIDLKSHFRCVYKLLRHLLTRTIAS